MLGANLLGHPALEQSSNKRMRTQAPDAMNSTRCQYDKQRRRRDTASHEFKNIETDE
jgi:hypothetical protein